MAKKIIGSVKLHIPAGKATPAPPVGPALGQQGVNIMDFCKSFNAQTAKAGEGMIIPVVVNEAWTLPVLELIASFSETRYVFTSFVSCL